MDGVLPQAGRAAPWDFSMALPNGNPSEQPCQPSENPIHPSSLTWTNPFSIMKTYSSSITILVLVLDLVLVLP